MPLIADDDGDGDGVDDHDGASGSCMYKRLIYQDKDVSVKDEVNTTVCKFAHCGCTFVGTWKHMIEHLSEHSAFHLNLLCTSVQRLYIKFGEGHFDVKTDCFNDQELIVDHANTFIWCIDDVAQEMLNAQRCNQQEVRDHGVRSQAFYIHKGGYRIRLILFFDGLNAGKGTHLSVYVHMSQGYYDDILTWPIDCVMSFELKDHVNRIDHKRSFGTKGLAGFDKPMSSVRADNKFSGIPKFARLSKLGGVSAKGPVYVSKNRMFIKFYWDAIDSVKTLTEFAEKEDNIRYAGSSSKVLSRDVKKPKPVSKLPNPFDYTRMQQRKGKK